MHCLTDGSQEIILNVDDSGNEENYIVVSFYRYLSLRVNLKMKNLLVETVKNWCNAYIEMYYFPLFKYIALATNVL